MTIVTRLGMGAVALGLAPAALPVWAQTKIEFFFPVPVEGKLAKEMTRLVKVYNEGQKEVEVTAVYTGGYDDTKLKAQAAAKAGKPPSVVLMSANFNVDLKLSGDIISLEPMLKADETTRDDYLKDFWPALHANAMVDGELYGAPFHNSTPLRYYNVEHFKEAGLDPAKPSIVLLSTGSLPFIRENMKQAYDVAFVPKNVRNAVPIGGASLVMFAGQSDDSKKAGWKFIKWLTTPETLGGWSRFTGYFAPRKSAYDKPEMKEFIAKNPDAKVALDQLPYAKPWFATYHTAAVRKPPEDKTPAMLNAT